MLEVVEGVCVCVCVCVSDIVIVHLRDSLRFSNEAFYGCGHNIVSVKITQKKKKNQQNTQFE